MLAFSGKDQKAQLVCLHYAKQFNAAHRSQSRQQSSRQHERSSPRIGAIFRQVLESAAEDRDNEIEVLGEKDLQHWMERSMNIISGYLELIGFQDEWDRVSDEN